MTPDEYQHQNDTLVAQVGDDEILIEGLRAHIRDLEAQVKRLEAENWNLRQSLPPPQSPDGGYTEKAYRMDNWD